MKDGKFETLVEIWRHLFGGKKIQYKDGEIVFLRDDIIITRDRNMKEEIYEWSFSTPSAWSIYEEPKPKKKVMLYRYIIKHFGGDIYETEWCSRERKSDQYLKILKTESKEVEYDDV